ncbi:MAG: YihA family ribosome biogenesis GTP-binding protein [Ignavibacteriales bacterium CG07_land_8_20_14_0_80_59_12]|nr:MAG: YihA family ribosome biogenesis GTP-binding protein [Ignavibacteriales bacterium CG07_land_8_20_14_0_80_59_12]
MTIESAEFVIGISSLSAGRTSGVQLPNDELPEVVFLGRSNVGKSSLLNRLCGKKELSRTNASPAKYREVNYYFVNRSLYFVDLPGYGYAKVPEQVRASWSNLIEEYLQRRRNVSVAVQIVDARHVPTELDLMMAGWIEYYHVPYIVVMTKADKIARSKLTMYVDQTRAAFARHRYMREIVPFSSVTGQGKQDLLNAIAHQVQSAKD